MAAPFQQPHNFLDLCFLFVNFNHLNIRGIQTLKYIYKNTKLIRFHGFLSHIFPKNKFK